MSEEKNDQGSWSKKDGATFRFETQEKNDYAVALNKCWIFAANGAMFGAAAASGITLTLCIRFFSLSAALKFIDFFGVLGWKVNLSVGAFNARKGGVGFMRSVKSLGWKNQIGFGLSFGVLGGVAGALSGSKACGNEMLKLPTTNPMRNAFIKT